jgi:molybdopterin synthase sulfur carrier subunit
MPRVVFTPQLRRFTETPTVDSGATTLRAALEDAFAVNPRLRGYVLDEQGHVRPNVVIFIDSHRCDDRIALTQPLAAGCTVHVLQALSGG